MKAGAQKCVTQRVKNTPGVGPPAGTPEKTRTWSIAMRTITAPRMMSIEPMRELPSGADLLEARDATSGKLYGPTGVRVPVGETTVLILGPHG
jgi:hypothetical protein